MKAILKLRAVSAYFSPNKVIVADDENLEIEILDKGQLGQRVVLLCNGKTYLADKKKISVPRSELQNVNVFELTERDEADNILRKVTVENLYVLPCKSGDGERLVAERKFYEETFTALLRETRELKSKQHELEKRVAELENGKFTMLKFGGKTK